MKLFDKFKEIFTEPVEPDSDDDLKVEQIKKEPVRSRVQEHTAELHRENDTEEEVKEEKEEVVEKPKHEVPFFTENDFADLEPEKPKKVEKKVEEEVHTPKREERKQLYNGAHYTGTYTSTSILTTEKPSFKLSPIISPVYGILDKNYSKEDIIEKKDSRNNTREEKQPVHDKYDEVRSKAYGLLENDIEDTMYKKASHAEEDKKMDDEIDLFDELEQEETKKTVRLDDTAELAKTVNEQEKNIRELEEITMDLTKELDNLLLKKESFNSKKEKIEKANKHDDEELAKDNDEPLTENELFNLIDSMYEEGKE